MRIDNIIAKKRDGGILTEEELHYFIAGSTDGSIPDYQISALLMAICIRGMNREETASLTMQMAYSGETVDLSSLPGIKVDKHSTGGVGDKTTLIAAPIAAALGVTVAKMSGRGLGHTGGTIDKMEAIPGMRTALSRDLFFEVVQKTGISVIGQSGNLNPADKKLYALRDVTATVESIPLIASSIMSKKIAAGADRILLDVKTGSGAFMKTEAEARALARTMVEIGCTVGRETVALVTNMDIPLGTTIGNALEICEVSETLQGRGPKDLTELCIELAANMVFLTGGKDWETCRRDAQNALQSGAALHKLCSMVKAQGGDPSYILHPEKFPKAPIRRAITAPKDGYITALDALICGNAARELGAGRRTMDDSIDLRAGIRLLRKNGDAVSAGQELAILYTADPHAADTAEQLLRTAYQIESTPTKQPPLILDRISRETLSSMEKGCQQ